MSLKQFIDEFENEPEPLLDEIIRWFKNNDESITTSLIQRNFQMGYRQASRALRQIKDRIK